MLREIGAFLFLGHRMDQQSTSAAIAGNGAIAAHDLFALTDEQILEIEPEAAGAVTGDLPSEIREEKPTGQAQASSEPAHDELANASAGKKNGMDARATANDSSTGLGRRNTEHTAEPPPWLAAQMKDPWNGEEAREFWNGVQQAKQEAAAYRAAFATPEDARALKELYPAGVNEARGAAERARQLDEIDRAYFGAAGKSAQEISASRAQLAQTMLRENPAAFREMVFAGLRALEDAGKQPGATTAGTAADGASPASADTSVVGAQHTAPQFSSASTDDAHVAAYAAFEKAANEDLERSVGATIEQTLQQALPNSARVTQTSGVGAQHATPLQARLSAAIRQDVEVALKGDRQLGEQVVQILSGRRLDGETRAQVVRLIGERAQQLVPVAAKRVLSDWTQTTLAAHRSNTARADAASARREVAPASPQSRRASLPAGSSASSRRIDSQDPHRGAARSDPRRVDYRKLSDEQILEM